MFGQHYTSLDHIQRSGKSCCKGSGQSTTSCYSGWTQWKTCETGPVQFQIFPERELNDAEWHLTEDGGAEASVKSAHESLLMIGGAENVNGTAGNADCGLTSLLGNLNRDTD